jgi:hypothetical protein
MKKPSEFILLSNLINILKSKEYYQTFAKSLLMTNKPEKLIPENSELVGCMFNYFIENNDLPIYYKNAVTSVEEINYEAHQRYKENSTSKNDENMFLKSIWENEIYVKTQELKKLYANKCIVLPKSLLIECSKHT